MFPSSKDLNGTNEVKNMKAEPGSYKGKPTLTLTEDAKGMYPTRITIGLAKAKLLLQGLESLKKFVFTNTGSISETNGQQIDAAPIAKLPDFNF